MTKSRVAKPVIKKRASLIERQDTWQTSVLTTVLLLLNEECDGTARISTPNGKACEVNVTFTEAASG